MACGNELFVVRVVSCDELGYELGFPHAERDVGPLGVHQDVDGLFVVRNHAVQFLEGGGWDYGCEIRWDGGGELGLVDGEPEAVGCRHGDC